MPIHSETDSKRSGYTSYALTVGVTAARVAAVTLGRTATLTVGVTAALTAGRMDGLVFATIALVAAVLLVSRDFF